MTDIIIRRFREEDWPQVWPVFKAVVAAGDSYVYALDTPESLARELWLERAPGQTIVACNPAGDLLGTAKMNSNYKGPGAHVATASFMVNPEFRRCGAGRALGNAALDWARAEGYLAMQFNAVVETNLPAVSLWQSLGFRIIGTIPEAFRHARDGLVGLHVMHRYL